MVQVKQANIFGRLGTGIGQGLAEQVPKEIENYRLRTGLKDLADTSETGNLSPAQFLAKAAGTYGITPQMTQSFGDLARQQQKGRALSEYQRASEQQKYKPFPIQEQEKPAASPQESPSITRAKDLQEIQKGFITPTFEQKQQEAARLYNENPARWGGDPEKAIQAINEKYDIDEKRQAQLEKKYNKQEAIQDNIINRLGQHSKGLGIQVPAEVYSQIEDRAINSTLPKDEGGEGLTEQQAMKKYGKQLNEISKDYEAIKALGGVGVLSRPSKNTLSSLETIQKNFESRGETELMAKILQADTNAGAPLSYAIAEPIKRNKALSKIFKEAPTLKTLETGFTALPDKKIATEATEELIPYIAANWDPNLDSPMAVVHELQRLNYDPQPFIDYMIQNADDMLSVKKFRQLMEPVSDVRSINDFCLSNWTGVE